MWHHRGGREQESREEGAAIEGPSDLHMLVRGVCAVSDRTKAVQGRGDRGGRVPVGASPCHPFLQLDPHP
jgi:hypothetical protein